MGEVTETVGSDVMANTRDGRGGREGRWRIRLLSASCSV